MPVAADPRNSMNSFDATAADAPHRFNSPRRRSM
jgi:hypothetical protein